MKWATSQTFGGTRNFLPQALAAWDKHAEGENATREAEARAGEQVRRECEERERRRRLADMRALLPEERLETLKRCTEEALAHEGVEHTHLGYDMLVKLKRDALLERESMRMDVEDHWEPLEGATADPRTR
jgi:hypothetical protein